ncbi:MAG: DUF3857 domain-containing transglutaminase family protein [Sulfurifustaceae bacterium]
MKTQLLIAFVLSVFSIIGHASAAEPLDPQVKYGRYYTTIVVNKDGTAAESREWSMTVLKEAALEYSKRASISYSTSAQKLEFVEAYTKKADGRRIDVPKDNYQVEINRGKGKDSPVYSDISTATVVFPDVAVGDSVVVSYRLIQTEPLFPGHFSTAQTFFKQMAFDDIRVRIEYPATLWVQYDARGMSQKESEGKDGRKVIEWSYSNPNPVKDERRDYSVFDSDTTTGFSFSTFRTYGEIASAYGARALPKAAITERIRKLAGEIVKDKTAPRDQARALYDWVATNITYAGNCIGIGAVVPRDLDVVLDNRMGDCKDHATLLQALLAARGIPSTQALVNAGPIYRLPKIPVASTVNHVINYIPSLNLYADSTSNYTPFGMLPLAVQDKPVLWVEGFKDGTKTPVPPIGSNQQKTKSVLKIAPDGSVSGTIEVTQKGELGAQMRAWARKLTKERETDLVKDIFRGQGKIGSGTLVKDDPTALDGDYHYKVSFTAEKYIKFPGSGAFNIDPPMDIARSIHAFFTYSMEPEKEADVVCTSGAATEEYVIELPKKMKVLSIPQNLKVANDFLSYSGTYKLKGNVLTVQRTIDDRTKGNVCAPQVFVEYKKFGDKVIDNLGEQVLYK